VSCASSAVIQFRRGKRGNGFVSFVLFRGYDTHEAAATHLSGSQLQASGFAGGC
jgi:hypothetical protein